MTSRRRTRPEAGENRTEGTDARTPRPSPYGPGPDDVPDPMPRSLRDTEDADAAFDDADPMSGDAPTG